MYNKIGYTWLGMKVGYRDGGTIWWGKVVDIVNDAIYLYFGGNYGCGTNSNGKLFDFIQHGPTSCWDRQFVLDGEDPRDNIRPKVSTIGMKVRCNGPTGIAEGAVIDKIDDTSYILFSDDKWAQPYSINDNNRFYHVSVRGEPKIWNNSWIWESPNSIVPNSLYCSCNGSSRIITILFQDVHICTVCKKEKR